MHTRPKFRNFGSGLSGDNPQIEQGSISTTLNGDTVLPLRGGYRLEHIKGKIHVPYERFSVPVDSKQLRGGGKRFSVNTEQEMGGRCRASRVGQCVPRVPGGYERRRHSLAGRFHVGVHTCPHCGAVSQRFSGQQWETRHQSGVRCRFGREWPCRGERILVGVPRGSGVVTNCPPTTAVTWDCVVSRQCHPRRFDKDLQEGTVVAMLWVG